jgi:hypothetical protein
MEIFMQQKLITNVIALPILQFKMHKLIYQSMQIHGQNAVFASYFSAAVRQILG